MVRHTISTEKETDPKRDKNRGLTLQLEAGVDASDECLEKVNIVSRSGSTLGQPLQGQAQPALAAHPLYHLTGPLVTGHQVLYQVTRSGKVNRVQVQVCQVQDGLPLVTVFA